MAEPMRIRAQAMGDKATVRVAMPHTMESGQRRDTAGDLIPAWHITEVTATHNGRLVLSAEWGSAVARNPYLEFSIRGAKAGDTVRLSWKDNRGDTRTDVAVVS